MALVLDTGVLYAALDEADQDHDPCLALLVESTEQLIVPSPVFVELDYWIRKFAAPDDWLTFCEDVAAGAYTIYPLDAALLLASAKLEVKHADLRLGLVDASVFAVCEKIGETKVATLDHRHFSVLRTSEGLALELVPAKA